MHICAVGLYTQCLYKRDLLFRSQKLQFGSRRVELHILLKGVIKGESSILLIVLLTGNSSREFHWCASQSHWSIKSKLWVLPLANLSIKKKKGKTPGQNSYYYTGKSWQIARTAPSHGNSYENQYENARTTQTTHMDFTGSHPLTWTSTENSLRECHLL